MKSLVLEVLVVFNQNTPTADPLVNRVISKLQYRSEQGMLTYGVTMERKDVTTLEWLKHAQEEAMDLAIYLQRCIEDLKTGEN